MANLSRNSEILFLYDAKQCNPNGDMDNENKPRMDWEAGRNLVSDVRLKRYIRDYLMQVKELPIFVRKLGDAGLRAQDSLALFKLTHLDGQKEEDLTLDDLRKVKDLEDIGDQLFDLVDVRIFGATIPIQVEEGRGASSNFTGPVQFNWGYSLNTIHELQESKTITSHLQTGKSEHGAGIGKDYRVNYSFLAFSGGINANVAQDTRMTDDDVQLLDEAIIKSIPLNRTRSKIGQTPRLYLRVEMTDNQTVLNDLREFVHLETSVPEPELRSIRECTVNATELQEYIDKFDGKIQKIHYWKDGNLSIDGLDLESAKFQELSY